MEDHVRPLKQRSGRPGVRQIGATEPQAQRLELGCLASARGDDLGASALQPHGDA